MIRISFRTFAIGLMTAGLIATGMVPVGSAFAQQSQSPIVVVPVPQPGSVTGTDPVPPPPPPSSSSSTHLR